VPFYFRNLRLTITDSLFVHYRLPAVTDYRPLGRRAPAAHGPPFRLSFAVLKSLVAFGGYQGLSALLAGAKLSLSSLDRRDQMGVIETMARKRSRTSMGQGMGDPRGQQLGNLREGERWIGQSRRNCGGAES